MRRVLNSRCAVIPDSLRSDQETNAAPADNTETTKAALRHLVIGSYLMGHSHTPAWTRSRAIQYTARSDSGATRQPSNPGRRDSRHNRGSPSGGPVRTRSACRFHGIELHPAIALGQFADRLPLQRLESPGRIWLHFNGNGRCGNRRPTLPARLDRRERVDRGTMGKSVPCVRSTARPARKVLRGLWESGVTVAATAQPAGVPTSGLAPRRSSCAKREFCVVT